MGLFDFLKKKNLTLNPQTTYFDILSSNPIPVDFDWTGLNENKVIKYYYSIPQLYTIVDYIAKVAANCDLKYFKKSGKEAAQGHYILDVLKNPHPLYSEGEFFETLYKQFELFNGVLIYKVKGGMQVSGLFVLPFNLTKIVPKESIKTPYDIILAKNLNEIIDHYEIKYKNKKYDIPVEDVWMITGSSLRFDNDGYLKPDNKIESLEYPLLNIKANYEARYSLVENRGALGMWVNQTKDAGSWMPLRAEDKKEADDNLRRQYGLTKGRNIIGITNADLRFESSSTDLKDLQLQQGIQADKIALCDAFSFPVLLLNELTGSTYSNLGIADKQLYTKNIIPLWQLIAKSFTREFAEGEGYFEFETSEIQALQTDQKQKADTDNINTTIIINLNSAITTGNMTRENAIEFLTQCMDIDNGIADKIIKPETEPIQQPITLPIENPIP